MSSHSKTQQSEENLLAGKIIIHLSGMSVEELSAAYGVSARSASRWAHGKQPIPTNVLSDLRSKSNIADVLEGVGSWGVSEVKETLGISNSDIGMLLGINASTVGKFSSGRKEMPDEMRDRLHAGLDSVLGI